MRCTRFRLALPFNYPDEGGGPPAPVVAPVVPGGNGAPAPGAPVVAPPTPVAPVAPSFSYKEDRSTWVPSHRVRQETDQRQRLETELRFERERVAALTGVKMPVAADPENDAIRASFAKLYPGLAKMEAMSDKLTRAAEFDYDGVTTSQQQTWIAHGNQVLQTLATEIKEAYGGAELTPKALKRIQHAFVTEVAEDPQIKARYEAGDMTIVAEFVKDYTGSNLDPYRRSTAAAPAGQLAARRLPRGGGGSAVVGARPPTLKPSDGDAFHKAAFDRYAAG